MHRRCIELDLSAGGCILGALAILMLPDRLLFSALAAAFVHECCHIAALSMCRVPVRKIRIGIGGAVIQCAPMVELQEFLCALAGPAGSLLCVIFLPRFPLFSLCALVQGIFNLLPVYPLDGGRMLCCIAHGIAPRHCHIVCRSAVYLTVIGVLSFCIAGYCKTKLQLFLILPLFFLFKTRPFRKTPCKEGKHWVQYS